MSQKILEAIPLEVGLKSDSESKALFGVQVAKKGLAKGHNIELDDVTLDQIVELGNAKPNGVKVRFGHPSMCTPALGTFLGVRKNFYRDGDYVRSDLYMSKAADPSKADHVMKMAKYEPSHIGNSVVIEGTEEYRYDENGVRLKDSDGNELPPLFRVTNLKAVDVVDEPAAGDGMFSEPVEGVDLSAKSIIELRDALDNPSFVARAISVLLGKQDGPVSAHAGGIASEKEVSMTLTLSELLEKHPAVAAEHAAMLSADKEKELAEAKSLGAEGEREKLLKILGHCDVAHFSTTAAYPKGFVHHVVEKNLSYEQALEGLLELKAKSVTLGVLEQESADNPVTSAAPNDKKLSEAEMAEAGLLAEVQRLVKGAN